MLCFFQWKNVNFFSLKVKTDNSVNNDETDHDVIDKGDENDGLPVAAAGVAAVVVGDVLVRSFDVRDDVAEQLTSVLQRFPEIFAPLDDDALVRLVVDRHCQILHVQNWKIEKIEKKKFEKIWKKIEKINFMKKLKKLKN